MIINHNMNALNAHRNMGINTTSAGKSMEKLSSGLRINRAGDDAAGLAISEKMRGQIRGLEQASRNSQDGISLIQTAEGALNETHNILQRIRELAVQASSDTNIQDDRAQIGKEITELQNEINRIASQTEFNKKKLINGSLSGADNNASVLLQVGANSKQTVTLKIATMTVSALGVSAGKIVISSATSAASITAMIDTINTAIDTVSGERAKLGTIANVNTSSENLTAAESRVRDVDMAKEMMNFSKNNILQQAAQAMLAQANQQPQGVLQLLR